MTNSANPSGRIVIAGGTGFLGLNLARVLADLGCEVVLISRRPPVGKSEWIHTPWDGRTLGNWAKHLDGAAALVNLAGRSVDCIKTPDHCDEILRSRVEATRVLGQALRNVQTPPPVWVQMSTAHRYGRISARGRLRRGLGVRLWLGSFRRSGVGRSVCRGSASEYATSNSTDSILLSPIWLLLCKIFMELP